MNFNKKSEKYLRAKVSLPAELQAVYEQFVDEYAFYTTKNYGHGYVAYSILADLIRSGWRPSAEPMKDNE